MQIKDLEVFREMPFLFRIKDEQGRYVYGNRATNQLANENVVGKTDHTKASTSVCRFVGELDGKKCVFGAAFVIA